MSTRIKKSDLARDALYEKVNTIADELDNSKVSKSGDTMTGQLAVKDANIILSSTKDVVTAIVKTNEDSTQTPTKNYIDAFRVLDKNNKIMSDFRSERNSRHTLTQMLARKNNADGTTVQADVTCLVDAQGNPMATLNQTTYVNGTVVSNLDTVNFIARSKSLIKGTTPTDTNKYVGYDWQDKNGQRLAYLGVLYRTTGAKMLELQKLDNNLQEFMIHLPVTIPNHIFFRDNNHTLGNVKVNTWVDNLIQFQDSKRTRLARVQPLLAPDGTARLVLAASKGTESESSLIIGSDGYTQCPKPADNSDTNAIATTNWAGGLKRVNTWLNANVFKGPIELYPSANTLNYGGYIDFHYNGSTSNYTSRIIESSKGTIEFASNTLIRGVASFSVSPKTNINGNARYECVCTGYTKGTAPTTNQFGGVSTTDKNGVEVAALYSSITTDNIVTSGLFVKQPTATGTAASVISIRCEKNGNFYTYAPQSSVNNSIDTIVEHGQWYIKYGSGILINWGVVHDLGKNSRKITFDAPFSNVWYYANVITSYGAATVGNPPPLVDTRFNIYDKQKTYFKVQGNNTNVIVDWFAIGYWKEWVQ